MKLSVLLPFYLFTYVYAQDIVDSLPESILNNVVQLQPEERPILTIFSTLKPNTSPEIITRHKNAIMSWASLTPRPNIILFGDEEGTDKIAQEIGGILHVPQMKRSTEFAPRPLVGDLFRDAIKLSNTSVVMFTNADMIYTQDLMRTIKKSLREVENFMLVGRRFDMAVNFPIDFSNKKWRSTFDKEFLNRKTNWEAMHNDGKWALDYFAFTRDYWNDVDIPAFILGAQVFDNWMLHKPNSLGKTVVDGSKTVLAVHQSHEWSHNTPKAQAMKAHNANLAGNKWFLGNTDRASHFSDWCGSKKICVNKRT